MWCEQAKDVDNNKLPQARGESITGTKFATPRNGRACYILGARFACTHRVLSITTGHPSDCQSLEGLLSQGRIAEFAGKSLNDIVLDQQESVSAEANGSDSSSADEEQDCSSLPTGDTQANIRQPMASDSGDNGKKLKKTRTLFNITQL